MIAHARRRWRPRGCAGAPGGLTNQIQNQSTTENNQVWVSDMTYLRTQQGWLYLATVMDIHTRQVIETFYNLIRCHSSLNYLSPNKFDRLNQKFYLGGR